MDLKNFFEQEGYVIVPNVVAKETIERMRNDHTELLQHSNLKTLPQHIFFKKPLFTETILNQALDEVKAILGEEKVTLYPNMTVRESIYLSFHNDSYFMKEEDEKGLVTPEFVQCSLYFQDNDEENGGGVTLIPKSHLLNRVERAELTKRVNQGEMAGKCIKTNIGDLVIWDARIVHSSTKPVVPPKEKKLALQWTVSRTELFAKDFIAYLQRRANEMLHVSDYEAERPLDYFADMPNVTLNSFNLKQRDALASGNINFVEIHDGV
ncbi:phytanoyl-CoA dioxygenase family protein [Paludibacterium purpuratum]|uniref:Phytanoyl-CoA dioxygenase PhyH n=1 Tax=Paludibacterium purpuratum TaxID=1144873 RepID=A0A4R7BG62_9NEIS|nr:phytanoyl-CoA dioxygenase family protein [Paludibacterium purpuratum]TDR82747.1 phytanoyl-CoA dioxygenase PhyH [Paludibacterium purpuratum]